MMLPAHECEAVVLAAITEWQKTQDKAPSYERPGQAHFRRRLLAKAVIEALQRMARQKLAGGTRR